MKVLRRTFCCTLLALAGVSAFAAQDAQPVVAAASRAMGLDGVSSIYYYGSGARYGLGQSSNANFAGARENLNKYEETVDFTREVLVANWSTFTVPPSGGDYVEVRQGLEARPGTLWWQHVAVWTTPWGFLKGAQKFGATATWQTLAGKRYQVVSWSPTQKSPGGQPYREVGYINADLLVEKVETWIDDPVLGDLFVETEFSHYRDNEGLKYPTDIVQKRGGWPYLEMQLLSASANSDKAQRMVRTIPLASPAPRLDEAAQIRGSDKLADGVYRIHGSYSSLAVEFADYVLLFEPGPESQARALAGIAEAHRLFPGKPIRYGVISHHHSHAIGGIAAVAAEGITIVTPEVNRAYLQKALTAPRTLAPDALSRSGRKPVIEGFKGDKRVFEDATRAVEIHVIQGLPHADGMVVAWLPKEKILAMSELFGWPASHLPIPNPPSVSTLVLLKNLQRLGIDPAQILELAQGTDQPVTVAQIRKLLGLEN